MLCIDSEFVGRHNIRTMDMRNDRSAWGAWPGRDSRTIADHVRFKTRRIHYHAVKGTTRTFGAGSKVGHDSTPFYNRRLYATASIKQVKVEQQVPAKKLDRIYNHTSESMHELPDDSVHLMVTSPPYNVGKDYDGDMTLDEYRKFLCTVWSETYRVLAPGGRACINVNGLGRKPYIPIHAYVIQDMIDVGFLMRGEIIRDKGMSVGTSCAWGSWKSPSNPVLRDSHEYILVFSKQSFGRPKMDDRTTITKESFMENTKSVWHVKSESATRVGHPAPFPVELPARLIDLYTYTSDVVLDPFIGSGSTAVAARQADRHYVGYDTSRKYCRTARRRLAEIE